MSTGNFLLNQSRTFSVSLIYVVLTINAYCCNGEIVKWLSSDGGNGHSYEMITTSMNFQDAANFAISRGGYLVSITSAAENAFLLSKFSGDYWIGASQILPESCPSCGWYWLSGEPWDYSNWRGGEPNRFDENCVHAIWGWNDLSCSGSLYVVIEYDDNKVAKTNSEVAITNAGSTTSNNQVFSPYVFNWASPSSRDSFGLTRNVWVDISINNNEKAYAEAISLMGYKYDLNMRPKEGSIVLGDGSVSFFDIPCTPSASALIPFASNVSELRVHVYKSCTNTGTSLGLSSATMFSSITYPTCSGNMMQLPQITPFDLTSLYCYQYNAYCPPTTYKAICVCKPEYSGLHGNQSCTYWGIENNDNNNFLYAKDRSTLASFTGSSAAIHLNTSLSKDSLSTINRLGIAPGGYEYVKVTFADSHATYLRFDCSSSYANKLQYFYLNKSSTSIAVEGTLSCQGTAAITQVEVATGGTVCGLGSRELEDDGLCWCEPGYYSSSGFSPCLPCENAVNNVYGSKTCYCYPGTYSVNGEQPCISCDVGSSSDVGATQCTCLSRMRSDDGKGPCTSCPVNSRNVNGYGNYGSTYPCTCNAGFVSDVGVIVEGVSLYEAPCKQCPEGSTTFVPTDRRCAYCSVGYYWDGISQCQSCPDGSSSQGGYLQSHCYCLAGYFRDSSSGSCVPCDSGITSTSIDASSCPVCAVGYYSPNGMPPCYTCPDGRSTSSAGGTSCNIAAVSAPPTISPTVANSRPTVAPTETNTAPSPSPSKMPTITRKPTPSTKPTVSPTAKPSVGDACPLDSFSQSGRGPCQPCPVGAGTSDVGMSVCDICLDNFYGQSGSPPCSACPGGTESQRGSSKCVQCFGDPPCSSITLEGLSHTFNDLSASFENLNQIVLSMNNTLVALEAKGDGNGPSSMNTRRPTSTPLKKKKHPTWRPPMA